MIVLLCLLAMPCLAAVHVYFPLSGFNANPSSNRWVTLQPSTPFPGNIYNYTSSIAGGFWVSNFWVGDTIGVIKQKGTASEIRFQVTVSSDDSGELYATNITSVIGAQTYPSTGRSAYSIDAANARFARVGSGGLSFVPQYGSGNLTNWSSLSTNVLGSSGGGGSATNVFFLASSNVTPSTVSGSNVFTVTGTVPSATAATSSTNVYSSILRDTNNGAPVLRLYQDNDGQAYGYNLIAGHPGNFILSGIPGSVVLGGVTNNSSFYTYTNAIRSRFSSILGGVQNRIGTGSELSIIGGGEQNIVGDASPSATIAGGEGNVVEDNTQHTFIGGGTVNRIMAFADYATITSGYQNTNGSSGGFIGSGELNTIRDSSAYSVLVGGYRNFVTNAYAFVGGGISNKVTEVGGSAIGSLLSNGVPFQVMIGYGTNNLTVQSNGFITTPGGASFDRNRVAVNTAGSGSITFYNQNLHGFSFTDNQATFYGNASLGDGTAEINRDGTASFATFGVTIDASGNLSAASLSGSGSGLTSLPAAQLTGTIPTTVIQAASLTGTHASPSTSNPLSPTWSTEVHVLYYGATGTINLPAASTYAGRGIIIYNTGSFTVTIDANGSEVIVRDGTVQTGGVSMTLSSGAGNYVALTCDGTRWITLGYKGTLAAGS